VLRTFLCAGLLTSAMAWGSSAAANGRFPRAERLLEDPRDPAHLILGATYGMLVTNDAGGSWYHVCEAAFADTGLQTDPVIALTPDGALLAGIYASVARSGSDACDFQKTLGFDNRKAVPDFTLSASVPGRAFAVMVSLLEDGASQNQLYRSDDGGQSWSALGPRLPASIRTVATIDVAPSNAERVYLSGLSPDGAGVLLRSDDGGETFEAYPVPTNAENDEVPYIAAVDPDDADAVYLRTDAWVYDPVEQVANANDALFHSSDAGAHFTELLRKPGKLFGFSFSPEGGELVVGYGDPVEAGGGRLTAADALGIYHAAKGSGDFRKRYAGGVGCLTWTAHGLYVCTLEADTGFSLGLIRSIDFELARPVKPSPLLRLRDVVGPVPCPACTSSAVCANYWESTCQSWGRTDCQSHLPPTGDSCGGATGEGGVANPSGGTSEGGATSEGGDGGDGEVANGGARQRNLVPRGAGCACRATRTPSSANVWWCLGALTLGLARRASAARVRYQQRWKSALH
jgi:hypothetical protein